MRRLGWIALAVLCLAGCEPASETKGPVVMKSPVAMTPKTTARTLDPSDEQALMDGSYPIPKEGLVLLIPNSVPHAKQGEIVNRLAEKAISYDWIWLRNPGVGCCIFPRLDSSQRAFIEEIVRGYDLTIAKENRIPFRLGPDGRRPIVMKNEIDSGPPTDGPATITAEIQFPTLEAAQEASRYIDPKDYEVKVAANSGGATLRASVNMIVAGFHGEEQAFRPFAKRFGGEFKHVTTFTPSRELTLKP